MLDAAEFKIKYALCVGEMLDIYFAILAVGGRDRVLAREREAERKSEMSTSLSKILPLLHATHPTLPHRQIRLTDGCGLGVQSGRLWEYEG